ncbi:flavin reductase family protein [Puerhibacterium puerhi]|uniref:flavin reductase family protein n=1 Tax=Puerhibacterium puerhi TaxID=2692623 RepID=UPI0013585605|nr:flavin reductase family protein [Puerhibacterium puerhi]
MTVPPHVAIDPAILYFGTPVILLSSLNEDGTTNLMPMSSVFWLGRRAVLGIGAKSQTALNIERRPEVVMNLVSADLVSHVDRLALTTGRPDVPRWKADAGYVHEPDKFRAAGLSAVASATVRPRRVAEAPVHLEAQVRALHQLEADDVAAGRRTLVVEAQVTKVWIAPDLRLAGYPDRVDPDRWRPLIMSFQHFYGLGARVHPSRLASIDEDRYRVPAPAGRRAEAPAP